MLQKTLYGLFTRWIGRITDLGNILSGAYDAFMNVGSGEAVSWVFLHQTTNR